MPCGHVDETYTWVVEIGPKHGDDDGGVVIAGVSKLKTRDVIIMWQCEFTVFNSPASRTISHQGCAKSMYLATYTVTHMW